MPPSGLAGLAAAGLIPPRSSLQGPTCLTMGLPSREAWAQRLGAFRASPSAYMAAPEGEDLGRDLLSDLRSEKLSEQTKVGPARPGPARRVSSAHCALSSIFSTSPIPRFPCWP